MDTFRIIAFVFTSISLLLSAQSFAAPIDVHIVSDGSWRTSDTLTTGWETLTFDDSGWDFARSPYPSPSDPTTFITGTTAQHIWHDPANLSDGTTGSIEAFFRFTFNLDIQLDSLPLVGQALINVDDDYDLFVNGTLAFENHDGGQADLVDFVDFSSLLQNGPNVISIHAVDGSWPNPYDRLYERVLFDGRITTVPESSILLAMALGILCLGFSRKSIWNRQSFGHLG